ncbi:uncharacterized protein GGS25DRAFT_528401 [Hypoxylon fragiforme]|uniref:uncharacterized protein n=1 Tax=Hypoxylon fragiforme TaxID=63214 RepID=UPI0020C65E66|nr:uncharacterized protein GGS25DRAFT_528401 [Hypoxylon fragiforme]KAI2603379.1 hypothetical protein GGS25DRAFT_528401 [Hypoxylon fragiforme]
MESENPLSPSTSQNRPREVHTKHLTELERFRVRTLYYDAAMSKKRISEVTNYSLSQIRTAIRAKSAAVPPRSGRPKKERDVQSPADADGAGSSAQGTPAKKSSTSTSAKAPQAPTKKKRKSRAKISLFSQLPPSVRQYIWYLVLTLPPPSTSTSPSLLPPSPTPSSALSLPFWLTPLAHPPHLLAGVFPEHWATCIPLYQTVRQQRARVLGAVNREARRVVLDTLTPVWCESGQRCLGASVPVVWLDTLHDNLYYRDSGAVDDLGALLEKARAAVLPPLPPPPRVIGPSTPNRGAPAGGIKIISGPRFQ